MVSNSGGELSSVARSAAWLCFYRGAVLLFDHVSSSRVVALWSCFSHRVTGLYDPTRRDGFLRRFADISHLPHRSGSIREPICSEYIATPTCTDVFFFSFGIAKRFRKKINFNLKQYIYRVTLMKGILRVIHLDTEKCNQVYLSVN